jgi:hypothetical protein
MGIAAFLLVLLIASGFEAFPAQAKPSLSFPDNAVSLPATDAEISAICEQLYKLLRISPKLTSAVARDPSLLGYQEYVSRSNPELAKFLQQHPEIMRNPEFYLFADLPDSEGSENIQYLLQRDAWPKFNQNSNNSRRLVESVVVFIFFIISLAAILWLLRLFLQNRRWNRVFKVQADIHSKLLDKLGGTQELLTYLGSDTGRKFMEFAPIASTIDTPQNMGVPHPFTRILAPLQVGIISMLIGLGLLFIKGSFRDPWALLLLGTIALMVGIGFMLSSGLSWMMAKRLGMIEQAKTASGIAKLNLTKE